MTPKLIKSDEEYEAALARVDALMSAAPGTREADELELWAHLVHVYEAQRWPVPRPDPIAVIRSAVEQKGWTEADLARCLGGRTKVAEVLNGRRALTLTMIRKLHTCLDIPVDLLLPEPKVDVA